jgi:GH15 family glucan-1,4-alpha-glucosidase
MPEISDQSSRRSTAGSVRWSVESILRHQEPNGALVASRDFSEYQYCWLRDGSFIAFALDRADEHDASARFHQWVNGAIAGISDLIDAAIDSARRGAAVDPAHMPPTRFTLDGSPEGDDDWPNFQIDGYGTWLWALELHLRATGLDGVPAELRESVVRVARYVDAFALSNCFDVWEESGNARHVSTLACIYGGLRAAERMLGDGGYLARAETVRAAAIEGAAQAGRFVKSTESDDVDASLLWLATPFGLTDAGDPLFAETVRVIEERLTLDGGLRRYPQDTYYGSGAWPVLTASLGWHYAALGDDVAAQRCRDWIVEQFDEQGRLAEQYGGEHRDREHYREWVARWGTPAANLAWSHAMHIVLCTELEADAR